jgi:hypothetical protein
VGVIVGRQIAGDCGEPALPLITGLRSSFLRPMSAPSLAMSYGRLGKVTQRILILFSSDAIGGN